MINYAFQKLAKSVIAGLLMAGTIDEGHGQIYVGNSGVASEIGKYTTVGSVVDASLITNVAPSGMALDTNGLLYVTYAGRIGVYTISGTPINTNLITGLSQPTGIALDGNGNIFVAIYGASPGTGKIAEYTTAGTTVNESLINGLWYPFGLALDGQGNLFVGNQGGSRTIGKYTTSGGTVNSSFITGLNLPCGLAADGYGNLYVADYGVGTGGAYTNGRIGKYASGGSTGYVVNSSLITNLNEPESLAFDASGHLFVGCDGGQMAGQGFIGEYSTNGNVINPSLVTGLTRPYCLAVDSMPTPAPTVALVKAVTPSFSNIYLGINYQLQVSSDMNTWTNCGPVFTATNTTMTYTQYWNVANWNELFFRLEVAPQQQ